MTEDKKETPTIEIPATEKRKEKLTARALFQMFGPFRETMQKDGWRLFKVLLAAFLCAFSVNVFLHPSGMLPGGFGGVSLLLQNIFQSFFHVQISFSLLNIALNILPAALAFFIVGRKFFAFSIVYIVAFSLFVDFLPKFAFTTDPVLNVIFGAVFNGVSAAVALNANASGGGTDFIAMIASTKYNIATWNYIFVFNVVVLLISGMLFGAEAAMYSMVFQLGSTILVNRLHARYQRKTLFIIANECEPIATDLQRLTNHGVTIFEGVGNFSQEPRYLIYIVVSKTDMPAIKRYLKKAEQTVFMNIFDSEELEGRFYIEPLE